MCQSYGQVYFNVTEPVSVRNYVSRSPPKWNLPLSLEKLDDGEKADIQKLASLMVAKQQKEAITPVFAVLASILASSEACDPLELEQRFLGYDSLLADFGTRCLVQGDLSKVIKECLDVHNAKITVDEAGKYSFRSPAEDQGSSVVLIVLIDYEDFNFCYWLQICKLSLRRAWWCRTTRTNCSPR